MPPDRNAAVPRQPQTVVIRPHHVAAAATSSAPGLVRRPRCSTGFRSGASSSHGHRRLCPPGSGRHAAAPSAVTAAERPGRPAERGHPLDRPTLAETIESSSPRPGPAAAARGIEANVPDDGVAQLMGSWGPPWSTCARRTPTSSTPTGRGRLHDGPWRQARPRGCGTSATGCDRLRRARLEADGHGGSHAGPRRAGRRG